MIIKVPASTANLGPGFDSIGMAVSLYLTVEVVGKSPNWQVDHNFKDLPHDERNLIVTSALKAAPNLKPYHLKVKSDIPLSHGLGSSSSAIIAGIELANVLTNLNLTNEQKVQLASQIEGHPDNVAPAILGGLVVGSFVNEHFAVNKLPLLPYEFIAYIPEYNLETTKARNILPKTLTYQQATHASAIANTLVASLAMKKYDKVGELLEADMFHEPYRQKLVPELSKIRKLASKSGALATYLSGAGPTVMTIIKAELSKNFIQNLQENLTGKVLRLTADTTGAQVIN